jgi:pyruvate kinase
LDTKGPEIRTGFFDPEKCPKGKITLVGGKPLKIVTDYSFKGDESCFALTYESICTAVKPGQIILCADGSLSLKVTECFPAEGYVMTEVGNDCVLGERKNCNLPGVKVDLPVLQDKDKNDLVNFGIPQGVHFCAASFVQSAADVKMIRETLGEAGKDIKIIPKIENQEGLINFDEIVEAADGIMIARGDLGMEIPPEKVFMAQKVMTAKCNLFGKPCITATQMLESMCKAPRPTRAEAGDVANAVLDGTDCVMLSGETAGGDFPIEAVTIMRRIVEEAERAVDFQSMYMSIRESVLKKQWRMSSTEAYASSAVKTAADAGAPLIICLTETGSTARILSKYRPSAAILAITTSEYVARYLLSSRGVISMVMKDMSGTSDVIANAGMEFAKKMGVDGCVSGAKCVLVTEEREGEQSAGISAKVVKIMNVP